MNFWPDFIKLKTSIGGNRELVGYEETFGMPIEEKMRITAPNRHIKRLISQLEFAIRLNDVNNGEFDDCIGKTLTFLLREIELEGVLSKTVCNKAEEMLMPCSSAAKQYKLILAGHAHIDMDWMWSYHETVAITLSTFRTVLNLMNQYPDFCFSQSQASVYKIIEEYDPDMMAEIQQRIREGRWEVTAAAWVETDKNMPNTESLLRHIQYTKSYLHSVWGIDSDKLEIDFSPDTFGHSANIPEIDAFGGVKYLYHCRGLDGDLSLFRWRSPSGKELMVYREQHWYNSAITPKIGLALLDIAKTCAGFKTGLIVYGVGDHGGGPTRRDVENAIEMSEWPIWPKVKFGTFAEFFHEAEAVRDQLPIIDREINYVSTGCYTTQTRIKRANRKAEALLCDAEAFTAFSGIRYNQQRHEQVWQNVLYTHFHDIITGSCVQDSRENAMGLFTKTFAYAQTQYSKSANAIAAMIDTSGIKTDAEIALTQSEGAGGGSNMGANLGVGRPVGMEFNIGFNNGVPNPERGCGKIRIFNIFNPSSVSRRMVTEITVWDWVGDMRRIQFADPTGNPLRFQLLDDQLQWFWDHQFLRVLVEAYVPAMGYTTVVMSEAEASEYLIYRQPQIRSERAYVNYIMENELIRAEFHRASGCLISLIDKQTNTEYIDPNRPVSLNLVTMERKTTDAWSIGKYLQEEALTKPVSISRLREGDLHQSFTAEYKFGDSTMQVTPILLAGEKAIRFCINVDWNEVTGATTAPLLTFRAPLSFKTDRFVFDVPGGAQYRKPMLHDLPGLRYGAAVRSDSMALAMIPDSKYGYRASEDSLAVSLINTANYPDPYPDRGQHVINIALAICEDCPKKLEDTATIFTHPQYFLSNNSHKGILPVQMSFLELEAQTVVLSAILPTEDPNVIHVRFYETCGRDDHVVLKFSKEVSNAVSVDLSGAETENAINVRGKEVHVPVKANHLGEVKVTFA